MPSTQAAMVTPAGALDDAMGRGRWAVAVFTSREPPATVLDAVHAAAVAATANPAIVEVLVNGNLALAKAIAHDLAGSKLAGPNLRLRVWSIDQADKAHCWNEYVHRLWQCSDVAFFVDGYVRMRPTALSALVTAMEGKQDALAATGVPTAGRSAAAMREEMTREGGIHGNLFALRRSTMTALRKQGFKLPLGIYRTDATLGAVLAFGLDPSSNAWEPRRRIAMAPDANWDVDSKRWWSWSDVRAQLKRLDRQAQGVLENHAVSHWLATCRRTPSDMPRTAAELVQGWAAEMPEALVSALKGHRRRRAAWLRLQTRQDWSSSERPARCLFDSAPQ